MPLLKMKKYAAEIEVPAEDAGSAAGSAALDAALTGAGAGHLAYWLGGNMSDAAIPRNDLLESTLTEKDFEKAVESMKGLKEKAGDIFLLKVEDGDRAFATDDEDMKRNMAKRLDRKGGIPQKYLVVTRHPNSAATLHELGHVASGMPYSPLGKIISFPARNPHLGPLGATLASFRAARKAADPDADDGLSKALDVAEYASRASTAYELADEAEAWRRALGALREASGMEGVKKGLRCAIPAFGSYAGNALGKHAIAPALAAMAAKALSEGD